MDFLPEVAGLDSYKESRKKASIQVVGDCEMAVLSFDDLIKNKRAVNRPIDQDDIASLEKKRSNSENL